MDTQHEAPASTTAPTVIPPAAGPVHEHDPGLRLFSADESLIPPSRPYTATGAEGVYTATTSARTSFTRVNDTELESSLITHDHLGEAGDSSSELHSNDGTSTAPASSPAGPQTPQVSITFLLISGRKRSMCFEPESVVGRVKELVWNSWPGEWEDARPPAPSYIRLLYLGKMLQDDDTLTKLNFPTSIIPPHFEPRDSSASILPPSTIVHLSIRPGPAIGDGDVIKKKWGRSRSSNSNRESDTSDANQNLNEQAGCCGVCVIC